jgi:hypothetical protein
MTLRARSIRSCVGFRSDPWDLRPDRCLPTGRGDLALLPGLVIASRHELMHGGIPISDLRRAPRMHPRVSSRVVHYRFISRFMRVIAFIPNRGHLRNEKVRGSSPLSSTPSNMPFD